MLLDRSWVHHQDGRTMTGDTIYYDKAKGFGQVIGRMEMVDSTRNATLTGEYGEMWEEDHHGFATDSALLTDWSDTLHLAYIHADTLFTEEQHYTDSAKMDSTYQRIRAYYGVRVFRDDMQMTCDSLVYFGSDSTMHLYVQPICWNENHQMSADSIVIYMANGQVEHAIGHGNALCVMQDSVDFFNQMSGKEATAYLEDGEMKIIDMSGNALTIFYPKEEGGDYSGMNTTESSFIRMYVENREIHHMRFTTETTGILYPMDQIPSGADRLALFFWDEEKRPISPEDVFRKVKNERVKE